MKSRNGLKQGDGTNNPRCNLRGRTNKVFKRPNKTRNKEIPLGCSLERPNNLAQEEGNTGFKYTRKGKIIRHR